MAKRDYYDVLGVAKNASDDDIKKAYRRLAMKHHPDRNQGHEKKAEEKFKEAKEAYEMLSDPSRRAAYDSYGFAGVGAVSEDTPSHDPQIKEIFDDAARVVVAFTFVDAGMSAMLSEALAEGRRKKSWIKSVFMTAGEKQALQFLRPPGGMGPFDDKGIELVRDTLWLKHIGAKGVRPEHKAELNRILQKYTNQIEVIQDNLDVLRGNRTAPQYNSFHMKA